MALCHNMQDICYLFEKCRSRQKMHLRGLVTDYSDALYLQRMCQGDALSAPSLRKKLLFQK